MRRPSILFINRVYPPVRGASGRVLSDLARSFAKEGWQVTVITTGPSDKVERDGAIKLIQIKAPERPKGALSYLRIWMKMLGEALRLPSSHIVVTMTDPPMLAVVGRLVSIFKKNRHIHWCQDLYPDLLPALGVKVPRFIVGLCKAISRKAMKKSDKVIVVGRCMARHLSYDNFDPKQITVIPNWPDFELVRDHEEAYEQGEALLHFGGEKTKDSQNNEANELVRSYEEQKKYKPKFRVLYAGNIGRVHPVDTILDAAEDINKDEHNDIEFVFVGDGPRYDYISQQRSKRNLDNIRLLPYQPPSRIKSLMESGDIHIVSMKEDAAGMVVPCKLYSALAAQRPCVFVGPALSEPAKILNDFGAGIVVGQGQAKALAEAIRKMRYNSDVWFKAHKGAVEASQIFVPEESINAWIERAWGVLKADLEE